MTENPITLGQKKQFMRFVEDVSERALNEAGLGKDSIQRLIERGGELQEHILTAIRKLSKKTEKTENAVAEWIRFYREFFGIEVNFSDLVLPEKQDGFNWLIVVPKGMTINRAIQACREHFGVWTYTDDLDEAVTQNDRNSDNGAYAIWIRDCIEADKENECLSANNLKDQGIAGITLLERVLLEAWHFWKFKKHLDIQNVTLCSGSRDSDGAVPVAYWSGDKLRVGWYDPGVRVDGLRARSVVS